MGTGCACRSKESRVLTTFNYDPTFARMAFPSPNVELAIKQLGLFYETEHAYIPKKLLPYFEKVLNGSSEKENALVVKIASLRKTGVDYLCKLIPFYVHISELRLWKSGIIQNSLTQLFQALTLLSSLKVLSLEDNGLKDDSILALVRGFNHMPELEEVWLGCNDISPSGTKVLADSLVQLQNLHTLDLGFNYIENAGCAYLCEKLTMRKRLKVLILQANLLDSTAVPMLLNLAYTKPPEEMTDVTRNKFSSSDCDTLIAAFGSEAIATGNQK